MAVQTACNARLRVDNAAGNLHEVSAESTLFSINMEHQSSEYFTFWDAVRQNWAGCTQCGRRASGVIRVLYDQLNSSARALLEEWFLAGGARTISVDVPRGAGGVNYECEAILTEEPIELDPGSADPVGIEFPWKACGMVTVTDIIS